MRGFEYSTKMRVSVSGQVLSSGAPVFHDARGNAGPGAFTLRIVVGRVFGRCRYPTQPDHHGDDVDINFYQVEIPSSRADRSSI